MVWPYLAYRLHGSEPIHLGLAWSVHPFDPTIIAEFYLVRCAGLEWRAPCHVCLSVRMFVAAANLIAESALPPSGLHFRMSRIL